MTPVHQLIAAYWAAAAARDWDTFAGLVAADVVYEAPQTRERVRGRAAYRAFNAEGFPGDWHLSVLRIVADEQSAASWIQMSEGSSSYPGLCFFAVGDDGLIARITDFWPEPAELPASRARLSERY